MTSTCIMEGFLSGHFAITIDIMKKRFITFFLRTLCVPLFLCPLAVSSGSLLFSKDLNSSDTTENITSDVSNADTIPNDFTEETIPIYSETETLPDHSYRIRAVSPNDNWPAVISSAKAGDLIEFEPGLYDSSEFPWREVRFHIKGTAEKPIYIRSRLPRQAIINGDKRNFALSFDDVEHVIIDGFTITNPSPYDIDGKTIETSVSTRQRLAEGIIVYNFSDVTIRNNLFQNIATRGILASCHSRKCGQIRIVNNVFTNVGDDTASGDINVTGSVSNAYIAYNLFSGNTDGVVNHVNSDSTGNIIERNICLNGKTEDCIDIKGNNQAGKYSDFTEIRYNVLHTQQNRYSGVTIQNESNNVKVFRNYFKGTPDGKGHVWVHGRSNNTYISDGLRNVFIYENYHLDNQGLALTVQRASDKGDRHRPVNVKNVTYERNYLDNGGSLNTCSSSNCEVLVEDNDKSPAQSIKAEFDLMEYDIWQNLCQVFSNQELIDAAAASRAARTGFNPQTLRGICQ